MAEGIPVDQANALTLKIQELEKKISHLEHDNKHHRAAAAARQLEVDQMHYASDRADEVYMEVIDRLLTRLEDR